MFIRSNCLRYNQGGFYLNLFDLTNFSSSQNKSNKFFKFQISYFTHNFSATSNSSTASSSYTPSVFFTDYFKLLANLITKAVSLNNLSKSLKCSMSIMIPIPPDASTVLCKTTPLLFTNFSSK